MRRHGRELNTNKVTTGLSDYDLNQLQTMAKNSKISKSEALRRTVGFYFHAARAEEIISEIQKMTNEQIAEMNRKMDLILARFDR